MKLIKVGSVTRAVRAEELLNSSGIRAKRRKLSQAGDGCSYVITVPDSDLEIALSLLRRNDIRAEMVMEG
ncbi:MAG: DUF3343 domain-containing protein [Clostridia bacterium]|nr:DUF3343 domain-containing protein [Clostridia bacterium]MBQ9994006.1 DUF3343 domain-containing protein [Clostridia bacterium]